MSQYVKDWVEQKHTAVTFHLLMQLADFDREKIVRKITVKENRYWKQRTSCWCNLMTLTGENCEKITAERQQELKKRGQVVDFEKITWLCKVS